MTEETSLEVGIALTTAALSAQWRHATTLQQRQALAYAAFQALRRLGRDDPHWRAFLDEALLEVLARP